MANKPTMQDITRAWEQNYDEPSQKFFTELGLAPDATILDIGAGGGSMVEWFAQQAPLGLVTALDIDVSQLEHLQGQPTVEVVQADVTDHQFPGQSFDLIFARGIFSVLPDAMGTLSRCRSWLRDGGLMIIEDFYFMDPADAPTDLGREILEGYVRASSESGADFKMARRLPSMLARAGFADVDSSVRKLGPGQGTNENALMAVRMHAQGDSLIERGLMTREQIDGWLDRLDDPTFQDITTLGIRSWGSRRAETKSPSMG